MREIAFRNGAGVLLSGRLCLPEKTVAEKPPVAIYAHGLLSTGTGRKFHALAGRLPQEGVALLTFDSHGRGRSAGDFRDFTLSRRIDGVASAVRFAGTLEEIDSERILLVGSSFGGLASLLVVAAGADVGALALVSPALNLCSGKAPESLAAEGLPQRFYEDAARYDPYAEAEKIAIPVLVVHGTDDEVVPAEHGGRLMSHLRDGTFVAVEGGDHRFEDERLFESMTTAVVDFLLRHAFA